jgi:hypothetical protein
LAGVAPRLEKVSELRILAAIRDRVEAENGSLDARIEIAEPKTQALRSNSPGAANDHARSPAMAFGQVLGNSVAGSAQTYEVRIRIEHDDAQARLVQESLQDHAERVRLSRARLPAQERVAVEPAGIESERHARREPQLADVELSTVRTRALKPGRHFVRPRRSHQPVVERIAVAVTYHPGPAHGPDPNRGRELGIRITAVRRPKRGPVDLDEREIENLTDPRRATALDDHIATGTNVEAMRRQLAREVATVDRRREWQKRLLEAMAQASESLAVLVEWVRRLAQDISSPLTI